MIRGIDHLVIAVADPDRAADELEERLGILVTGGGRHERFGTRNRIAWLAGGPYLELIGIEDPALVDVTPVGRAARDVLGRGSAGLAAIAVVDDDLRATAERLATTESTIRRVQDGSRRRADGEIVAWRAAFPEVELAADGPPFLIEHEPTGAEWSPRAVVERAAIPHRLGGPVELIAVDIATDDPRNAADGWSRETGLPSRAAVDLAVVEVGGHLVRFRPRREMAFDAAITLSAGVAEPIAVDAAGLRWQVVPAVGAVQRSPVGSEGYIR